MGDSLPWTPMISHAKFDAASFILGREIRNRTITQKRSRDSDHAPFWDNLSSVGWDLLRST